MKRRKKIKKQFRALMDLTTKKGKVLKKIFGELNKIFADFFQRNPPVRSAVEVSALPMGARIEIEAIASI